MSDQREEIQPPPSEAVSKGDHSKKIEYESEEGSDSDDVPDLLGRRRRGASDEEDNHEADEYREYEEDDAGDADRHEDETYSEEEFEDGAPPETNAHSESFSRDLNEDDEEYFSDTSDEGKGEGSESFKPANASVSEINAEGEEDEKQTEEETKEEVKKIEPFVVPTSGAFYMHDDRFSEDVSITSRGGRGKKLWQGREEKKWSHDMFENMNSRNEFSQSYRGQRSGNFSYDSSSYPNEEKNFEFENSRGRGRGGVFRGRGRGRERGRGGWRGRGRYGGSEGRGGREYRGGRGIENNEYGDDDNERFGNFGSESTPLNFSSDFNADAPPFHPQSFPNLSSASEPPELSHEKPPIPQSIEEFDRALRNGDFAQNGSEIGESGDGGREEGVRGRGRGMPRGRGRFRSNDTYQHENRYHQQRYTNTKANAQMYVPKSNPNLNYKPTLQVRNINDGNPDQAVSDLQQKLERTNLSGNVGGLPDAESSGDFNKSKPVRQNLEPVRQNLETKTSGKMRVDAPDFSPSNLSFSGQTSMLPVPPTYNNAQTSSFPYPKTKLAWVPLPVNQPPMTGYGMTGYTSMPMKSPDMYYPSMSAPQNVSMSAPMAPMRNDFNMPYNNQNYLNRPDNFVRKSKPRRYSEMSFEK